jgi:hypothetical protein
VATEAKGVVPSWETEARAKVDANADTPTSIITSNHYWITDKFASEKGDFYVRKVS